MSFAFLANIFRVFYITCLSFTGNKMLFNGRTKCIILLFILQGNHYDKIAKVELSK